MITVTGLRAKERWSTQCLAHVRIIVRYTRRETRIFRQVSMNRSTTYPSEDKRRREDDSPGGGRTGGKKIRARLVRTCLHRASRAHGDFTFRGSRGRHASKCGTKTDFPREKALKVLMHTAAARLGRNRK